MNQSIEYCLLIKTIKTPFAVVYNLVYEVRRRVPLRRVKRKSPDFHIQGIKRSREWCLNTYKKITGRKKRLKKPIQYGNIFLVPLIFKHLKCMVYTTIDISKLMLYIWILLQIYLYLQKYYRICIMNYTNNRVAI